MAARKPSDLIVRNETLEEKNQRISRENANKTGRKLPSSAPKELKGHPFAQAAWRRLMRDFGELKAERVDSQDFDMMVSYCLALEEENDLVLMLVDAKKKLARGDEDVTVKSVLDIDARLDRKRSLLSTYQQQMYMTPRARAGVVPEREDEDDELDPMEELLNSPVVQLEAMVKERVEKK